MIKSLINRIHKCQSTFFGQVIRREILEHLIIKKKAAEENGKKMLDALTKWLKVGCVLDAIKVIRD